MSRATTADNKMALFAAVMALAAAVWMMIPVIVGAVSQQVLEGQAAQAFAAQECQRIKRCLQLRLVSGYDWTNGQRQIIWRFNSGVKINTAELTAAAGEESGWLGWVLAAPAVPEVDASPPSAATKGGGAS